MMGNDSEIIESQIIKERTLHQCANTLLTLSPSVSREPQTIWKYNAINHLLISHSDEDTTQPGKYKAPVIPGDLMMDMFVTRQEEQWMKSTQTQQQHSAESMTF